METTATIRDGESPNNMTAVVPGRNGKWKLRLLMTVVLLVPLWVVPSFLRALLADGAAWWVGVLLSDVLGVAVVGFLTNNYRFGVGLYLAATALELALVAVTGSATVGIWLGDLIPALVAIYFAQQLFINMGD